MQSCGKVVGAIHRFDRDEAGMEALQSVTIFALAAMVLAGVYWIWNSADVGDGATGATAGLRGTIVANIKAVFETFDKFAKGD